MSSLACSISLACLTACEPVSGADGKVKLEVKVRSGAQSGVLTETEIPFAVEQ
jgi:hypothetical protein